MAHPTDKKDRFIKGAHKGIQRAKSIHSVDFLQDPKKHEECLNKTAKLTRHTTKLCSCPMCGNPRKFFGEKTFQEKKFEISSNEE
jgi:hypothetical protein